MSSVAVFDSGKTNLKLMLIDPAGRIVASTTTPSRFRPAPPYRHADLAATEAWLLASLRALAAKHRIDAVVVTAHGSGGVLVDEAGPVLPMLDYEETVPAEIDAAYRRIMPPYQAAGSGILGGATHLARQLLWLETRWPEAVARARHFLPLPQYWAWRLSGVPALELTSLGAQSHLWDAYARDFTGLVESRGWRRLLPALTPAWAPLGPATPTVRAAAGLPADAAVLCGIHDSSGNFYRYQQAGLGEATLLSTGTWIVGLRAGLDRSALVEERAMTANVDVAGNPLAGILTMTGREHAILAGDAAGPAEPAALTALVRNGTLPLPSFAAFDGVFPGSAGRGRIVGPEPDGPAARAALAVLYCALVADACLDFLRADGPVVLDGAFVGDPAFAGLLAALRPGQEIRVDPQGGGTALGAALLWGHAERRAPVRLALSRAEPLDIPGLAGYRERWRALAETETTTA